MIDLRLTPVVRVLVPFAGGSLAGCLGSITFTPVIIVIPGLLMCMVLMLLYHLIKWNADISRGIFSQLSFALFLANRLSVP